MKKWTIQPVPTEQDPLRHVLRIEGDMKDVIFIVGKLGAICGRPERVRGGDGYNFKIFLHKLTPSGLESLNALLDEMAPKERTTPPPTPAEIFSELSPGAEEPPARGRAPAASEGPLVATEILDEPAVNQQAKPLWGLQTALDDKRNFESLLVGPFNRFAHAAATSVVGSPGSMYNPLFIHGGPGVGKTHMMHALGSGLAKVLTADKVLLTSGGALSNAVSQALAAGKFAELDGFINQKKAILVDDIHLLAVSEMNQASLANLFAYFFSKNLQVILTSLYPPRALGSLEEALKFSLSKGWAVDMKNPSPQIQKDMILGGFVRYGLNLSDDEIAIFHEKLAGNYFESSCWMRRVAALKKMREQAKVSVEISELMDAVFAPPVSKGGADFPSAADLESVREFAPPSSDGAARNLAVLVPRGQEGLSNWVVSRFHQASAALPRRQSFKQVLVETYDPEQPFGVPFQIAEKCQQAGAQGALILGPAAASKLVERASEFSHAVRHLLESLNMGVAWIPHNGTMAPVHFTHAHLDFQAHELFGS